MTDYAEYIAAGSDDAANTGILSTYNETNTYYAIASTIAHVNDIQGWRFLNVPIAQGAVITSAVVNFRGGGKCSTGPCRTKIWGVDADDINTWETFGINEPKDATKTTEYVESTLAADFTPDSSWANWPITVTAIVQEIVDRGGWASGNDMAFVTKNNGTTGRGIYFNAHCYEHSYPAAELVIEFVGDETISMSVSVLSSSANDVALVTGAVSRTMDTLSMGVEPLDLVAAPGEATIINQPAGLTLAPLIYSIIPGATSIQSLPAELTASALDLSAVPGAVIILMNVLARHVRVIVGASSEPGPKVIPGPVATELDPAELTALAETLQLSTGATLLLMNPVAVQLDTLDSSIIAGLVVVEAEVAALNIDPLASSVLPGAAEVAAGVAEMILNALTASLAPGAVEVSADVAEMVLNAVTASLVSGAVSIPAGVAELNINPLAATLQTGLTIISLDAALLQSAGLSLAVLPGNASIAINTAQLVILSNDLSVLAESGALVVLMGVANMALSANDASIGAGAIFVAMAAAQANIQTISAPAVLPGAAAFTVSTAEITSGVNALTITPGAASVDISTATLFAVANTLSIFTGVTLLMGALELTSAVNQLAVIPGAASVPLGAAVLTIDPLKASMLGGAIAIGMATATTALNAETLQAIPGMATVSLEVGTLNAALPAPSIYTEGSASILMSIAAMNSMAEPLTAFPGPVAAAAALLNMAISTHNISITPGAVSIPFNPAAVAMAAQPVGTAPGPITVMVDGLALNASTGKLVLFSTVRIGLSPASLSLEPGAFTISTGAISIQLSTLQLAGQALNIECYTVSLPDGRTVLVSRSVRGLLVEYDDRGYVISGDGRILVILTEKHTLLVDEDSRLYAVVGEDRQLVVEPSEATASVGADPRAIQPALEPRETEEVDAQTQATPAAENRNGKPRKA